MNIQLAQNIWSKPDLLADYSLEMTAKDVSNLEPARALIPPGTSISVTFLPGEHLDARVAAAAAVKRLGFVPVPHISARRIGSVAELELFLSRLATEVGIDRAFVVAGDPDEPMGPYQDALAIIESGILARFGVEHVGIGGYPEGHPQISAPALWQALRDKTAAIGAAGQRCEIVTQFGFDAEPIAAWLEAVRAEGIVAPVRVGLPGHASVKTLLRFAARCGVGASTKVLKKYGMSITKLLTTAGPDTLVKELQALLDPRLHGAVKCHLYPFGGLPATAAWAQHFASAKQA